MTFQRRQKGQKIDVDRKYSESFQRDLGTCYITAGPEERENGLVKQRGGTTLQNQHFPPDLSTQTGMATSSEIHFFHALQKQTFFSFFLNIYIYV